MRTFDATLYGSYTQEQAIELAMGLDWMDVETREQDIKYKDHITTVNGVGVWYDFGADYYFFTDEVVA